MENNVKLNLIGITYNQIESGVYALILEDPVSGTRLPIVIGYPEAQSIECCLQRVKTPRPLTHDLLSFLLQRLNAKLLRVDIIKLATGPYAGLLTIEDCFGKQSVIDARSSDAVALAIRVGAPIFTTRDLIEKEGFAPQIKGPTSLQVRPVIKSTANPYSRFSLSQLNQMLSKAVEEENYEKAAEINEELKRRREDD